VSGYANSGTFWEPCGRTLAENFSIFARAYFDGLNHIFLGDVAELLGTMSALMTNPDSRSPWAGHRKPRFDVPGSQFAEAMSLRTEVLGEDGMVRSTMPSELGAQDLFEASVHRFADGSCILACQKAGG